MQDQLNEYKKLWVFLERTVKISILQEKYYTLLSNAVQANQLQAETDFNLNKEIINLD